MSTTGDLKDLFAYIEAHGFKLVRERKHYVFQRGSLVFVLGKTPSCPRAILNSRKDFERILRSHHEAQKSLRRKA